MKFTDAHQEQNKHECYRFPLNSIKFAKANAEPHALDLCITITVAVKMNQYSSVRCCSISQVSQKCLTASSKRDLAGISKHITKFFMTTCIKSCRSNFISFQISSKATKLEVSLIQSDNLSIIQETDNLRAWVEMSILHSQNCTLSVIQGGNFV